MELDEDFGRQWVRDSADGRLVMGVDRVVMLITGDSQSAKHRRSH